MRSRICWAVTVFITLCSPITILSGWRTENVIAETNFDNFRTNQGLGIGPDGTPYIVYGGDNLRFAAYNGLTWDTDIIDPTPGSGGCASIIVMENGDINVLYSRRNRLACAFRASGSDEWDIQVISTIRPSWISSAADTNGDFHVAVFDRSTYCLYYLTNQGSTWTQILVEYIPVSSTCSIALTSTDQPAISFSLNGALTLAHKDGDAWTTQTIYHVGNQVAQASLAFDSFDMPHIAIVQRNVVLHKDLLRVTQYTGTTWITEDLDESDYGLLPGILYPRLMIDSSDHGHLVYSTYIDPDVKIAQNEGSGWSIQTVETANFGYLASIALDAAQEPQIAAFVGWDIRHYRETGGTWTGGVVDTSHFGRTLSSSITLNGLNEPNLAIQIGYGLYHGYKDGNDWAFELIDEPASNASGQFNDIIIDDSETIHISFNNNMGGVSPAQYAWYDGSDWQVEYLGSSHHYTTMVMGLAKNDALFPYFIGYDYDAFKFYFYTYDGLHWLDYLVDDAGDVGEYSSIAVNDSGTAHISYMEHDNYDLRYATGLDDSWSIETVDAVNFAGMYNDIAVNSTGIPFISYYSGGLKMAQRTGGTWSSELVSNEVRLGDTAICIDSTGHPHIVADNKYCVWDGSQWNIRDYDLNRVERTDLVLDDSDNPHILYYDVEYDLKYITLDSIEPAIASIAPAIMYQGLQYPGTLITGTGFTNVTSIDLGDGIRTGSWSIDSDSQITADIFVYAFAPVGPRDMRVQTLTGNDICRQCLAIGYGPPHLQSIEPETYPLGQTLDVLISGTNFADIQSVDFGMGVTVNGFETLSLEEIRADISIDSGATPGYRDVSITSPAGTGICSACFEVDDALSYETHFLIDPIPFIVYTGIPFQIRVRAVDASDRVVPTFNETISLTDTVTGTVNPSMLDIVNGVGTAEAILPDGAHDNRIEASYYSMEGLSNSFNVLQALADCDYHTIENPVYLADPSGHKPSRHIRVTDQGTVWIAFGEDNMWAAKKESGIWSHSLVDPESGVGWGSSLALDPEGKPRISYSAHHYFTDYSVRYAVLTDYGWQIETIEDVPCTNTSLDIGSDGLPHVCYGSNTGQKYAVKNQNGWQISSLVSPGAQECSLVVDGNNQPHMVFPSNSGFHYFGYLGGTWTHQTLSLGNGSSCSINVDSSNQPHVVARAWLGGSDYAIAYGHWTGSTWASEYLPDSNYCSAMNLIFDSADHPVVTATYSISSNQKAIRVFTYDGSTWSHTELSLGENDAGSIAAVDIDNSDTLHFHHFNRTEWGLEYDQKTASTWDREIFQRSGQIQSQVNIMMDPQDLPVVGYDYATHTFDEWYVTARFATYTGNEWFTEGTDTGWSQGSAFSLRADGSPAFVYYNSHDQYQLHYRFKNGSIWTDEVIHTSDQPYSQYSIVNDLNGIPWVVFRNEGTIRIAERAGMSWTVEDIMTLSSGDKGPCMAIGPDGYIRLAYESNEIEYSKMYLATQTVSGWDISVIFDEPVGDMLLAVDSNNTPHVVFQKSTGDLTYLFQTGRVWQEELLDDDFSYSYSLGTLQTDSLDRPNCCYSVNFNMYGDYDVRYAVRTAGGWQIYTADVNGSTGPVCAMVLDSSDVPHFAYQEFFGKDLRYATCGIFTPPEIDSISPASAFPGETIDGIILDGIGLYTVTRVDFGDSIVVDNFSSPTNSTIVAEIRVDSAAVPGARDVRVVSPAGTDICSNCFVVLEPGNPPVIDTIDPPEGLAGDMYRVIIQGKHLSESQFIGLGDGLDVVAVEELSSEALDVQVTINPDAASGSRDVTIVTNHGQTVCRDCFTVIRDDPTPTPTPSGATPTPTASCTPTPTPTSTATWTPTPSSPTPTPTGTPTPPSPTPTSGPCTQTGVTVTMPSALFHPGETCNCYAIICNAEGQVLVGYPLFVILDVYGSYFFAPSFSDTFDYYLDIYPEFPVGETVITVIPDFEWPSGAGSASGLIWYGALTNPEISDLFGDLGTFEFGWDL